MSRNRPASTDFSAACVSACADFARVSDDSRSASIATSSIGFRIDRTACLSTAEVMSERRIWHSTTSTIPMSSTARIPFIGNVCRTSPMVTLYVVPANQSHGIVEACIPPNENVRCTPCRNGKPASVDSIAQSHVSCTAPMTNMSVNTVRQNAPRR